tara:strand:- start:44 stop:184 length:141 start_codon:yes stop_codon:yes gene_type:complete
MTPKTDIDTDTTGLDSFETNPRQQQGSSISLMDHGGIMIEFDPKRK